MHILVYMYVFIYRKLESSFIYFNAIYIHILKKNGRHGFNCERRGEREEQSFPKKAFLTSCKAGGCSTDVNSFIFVKWTAWTLMLLYISG